LSRESTAIDWGAEPQEALGVGAPVETGTDSGPLGWLPRLSLRQVRLERWLQSWSRDGRLPRILDWLEAGCGGAVAVDRPEVLWRASGLNRAGMIAILSAPRLATRLAIGIENALAHAVVDRLLGFDRSFAESRLQLTPVEWGVWTFLILRALDDLDNRLTPDSGEVPGPPRVKGGPPGPGDWTLDRAGPDPFDPSGLGPIITIRWSVRIGTTTGAVRMWLPESVVQLRLDVPPAPEGGSILAGTGPRPEPGPGLGGRTTGRGELSGQWRAEAGSVAMPQGLRRLRVGGVLPLSDAKLSGSPASPAGSVDLVLDLDGPHGRFRIPATPVPDSGGRLLRLEDGLLHEPQPRDPILVHVKESRTMSQPSPSSSPAPAPEVAALDVPVTLTVELGRVNLTLTRLADLKPGDVIELSRHSRAPVELTSNGRLVARGELILIDTDLGVRVTSVFL
jgi:flagellar motor switch protein FliN